MSKMPGSTNAPKAANGSTLPPLPQDHLSHPQNWQTGEQPATAKQRSFVQALEGQNDISGDQKVDVEHLNKSDASVVIDHLKHGQPGDAVAGDAGNGEAKAAAKGDDGEVKGDKKIVNSLEEAEADEKNEKSADEEEKADEKESNGAKETSTKGDAADPIEVDTEPSSPSAPPKRKHTETSPDAKRSRAEAIKSAVSEPEEPEAKKPRTDTKSDGGDELVEGLKAHDGAPLPPLSPDHVDHPERWQTGGDPATGKQKAFIESLEQQKGAEHVDVQGKSEASERIDELKNQ